MHRSSHFVVERAQVKEGDACDGGELAKQGSVGLRMNRETARSAKVVDAGSSGIGRTDREGVCFHIVDRDNRRTTEGEEDLEIPSAVSLGRSRDELDEVCVGVGIHRDDYGPSEWRESEERRRCRLRQSDGGGPLPPLHSDLLAN